MGRRGPAHEGLAQERGLSSPTASQVTPTARRRAAVHGLQPKVGIFLMAFLPQFVPSGMDPAVGVVLPATCYLATGLIWLLIWMRLVHRFARHMHSAGTARVAHGLTAVIFSAFAVRLALGG
ncbi:LysE family translocator [Streptomyces sp. NPDC048473]|uniref:LysE family translocator n=1 Tax=unclassified Streptomyces TaxID=2593676 RepID=UPI0037130352